MLIDLIKEGNVLVVRVKENRLDARVAIDFRDSLKPSIDEGVKKMVINLDETDFVDSSGLGVIISILKSMGVEGDVAVCNVNGPVSQMFKLTRMDKVIAAYPSEEEAIDALTVA